MTVDLEAIARRSDSDLSSLKLALPLIEQGFAPPFLARYRRDELGGVGERALWMLTRSIRSDQALGVRREELTKVWQRTRLADSSLEKAIRDAKNRSAIGRVARRLKNEPSDSTATIAPEVWVASRILNPEPGDSGDIPALAAAVGQAEHLDKITETLDRALARRLAEHPQVQAGAVRWLMANASIRFLEVSDPNIEHRQESEAQAAGAAAPAERPETEPGANWPSPDQLTAASPPSAEDRAAQLQAAEQTDQEQTSPAQAQAPPDQAPVPTQQIPAADTASPAAAASGQPAETDRASGDASHTASLAPAASPPAPALQAEPAASPAAEPSAAVESGPASETSGSAPPETNATAAPAEPAATAEPAAAQSDAGAPTNGPTAAAATDQPPAATGEPMPAGGTMPADEPTPAGEPAAKQPKGKKSKAKAKPIVKQTKVFKKLSPRQRRRRWLIGILQPLVGKTIPIKNLSPFQTLVLSRALRANLVRCQFVYDANQLIAQLRKTAASLNPALAERLSSVVAQHEASIRESSESVWWDELQDVATNRLVDLTAAHLDEQLHRGAVQAQTVLAIDAVGPRTSPISIVSSDGRLLHTEDIASQLDNELRTASVTRLGELIHRFGVDLIVISNGPARRAAMIILGELIAQSPEGSIRWTIAERSGADAYASGELADREMRVTPRRFRAAAWLAFSLLKPAWALSKVDPLKLRLSAAQRELPEELLAPALHDVMTSAVSRGGLDVNAAAVDSLAQLPGVTRKVAEAIDRERRKSLFTSREQLLALEEWPDEMHGRQAIGFLRVFGGDEPLDATVIHPEDYSLARKLAKALNLELPPSTPPGYQQPSFDDSQNTSLHSPADAPAGAAESAEGASAADAQAAGSGSEEHSPFAAELMGDASAGAAGEPQADTSDAAAAPSAEGQSPEAQSSAPSPENPPAGEEAAAEAALEPAAQAEPASEPAPAPAAGDETPAAEETAPTNETPAAPQAVAEPEPQATGRQPLPDPAAINKCIREWQVGSSRAHRLVHALCDPFGEEALTSVGTAPAVMTRFPKTSTLRSGDEVVGVVASVAPFGAFVEISPELTGLIRVSRLAEEFVEEIHDFIQVGDVVTAWVTEIDSRRRLQLSALSPEREQEMRRQRQEQREHRNQRRGGGPARGGQGRGPQGGQARGGQPGGQERREGARPAAGQPIRGGQGGARPASRDQSRRGGGRDDSRRGDSRGRDRGGRRDEPVSYTTRVAKNQPPAAPISEAMAEGKEPLRSFGDLLQFLKKDAPAAPTPGKAKGQSGGKGQPEPPAQPENPPQPEGQTQPENTSSAEAKADVPQAGKPPGEPGDGPGSAPQHAQAESAPANKTESQPDHPRQATADNDEFRSEPTAANDKPA